MKKDKILVTSSFALVSLLSAGEASFLIDNSLKIPTQTLTKGKEPVCYIGDTYFTSIEKALNVANNNNVADTIYVIPGVDTTINDDVQIDELDVLCLPYENETYINDYQNGDNTNGLNDFADSTLENVKIYRTTKVKIKTGHKLTNYGKLIVGGYFGSANTKGILSHVSYKYTEIELESKASIDSYGTIECYGYIKEANETIEDQNLSNGSSVNILGGGLKIPFVIYDFTTLGGINTTIDSGVFPFQHYDFPNIQSSLNIYYNTSVVGILRGSATIIGMKADIEEQVPIISSNANSLFIIENGYITLKYNSNILGCTTKLLDIGGGSTLITGHGDLILNHIYINLENQVEVDTATHPIPLTYKIKLSMSEGNLIINYPLKVMPGAFIKINKEANLVINSTILFYPGTFIDDRKSYPYPRLDQAFLEINGNIGFGSEGKIGGLIKTSNSLSDTILDFTNLTSNNLSAMMKDGGSGGIEILEYAKGNIAQNIEDSPELKNFLPGENYYSYNQYRIGNIQQGNNLSVQIEGLDESGTLPENLNANYSIEIADDNQGTNRTNLVLNASINTDVTIETGKYFRLICSFGKNIYAENHSEMIFDNATWNLCTDDLLIHITPVEIVKPTIGYGGEGVNHTGINFSIYASKTIDGVFDIYNGYQNLEGVGSSGIQTLPIEKDLYIKIVYNDAWDSGETLTFKFDDSAGTNFNNYIKHSNENVYKVTDYFDIRAKQDYKPPCFEKGTKVLTNRGYISIEDIKKSDYVVSFNHFKGDFELKPIALLVNHGEGFFNVIELYFSDKSYIGLISRHGLFDVNLNRYVDICEENCFEFLNHKFLKYDENSIKIIELIKVKIVRKKTSSFTLISSENLNCIGNNLINITSVLEGIYNIFTYDANYQYNIYEIQNDIKEIGLFTFKDFESKITQKVFIDFGFKYFKIAIEKRILTLDQLDFYINWFYELINSQEAEIY